MYMMQEKCISEMNVDEKIKAETIFNRSIDIHLTGFLGATDRVVKALFLINGGGVVTLLSYLHGLPTAHCHSLLWSLGMFLLGVFLIGIIVVLNFDISLINFNKFINNFKRFFHNETIFSNTQKIGVSVVITKMLLILGHLSFVCFLIGVGVGLYGYLSCTI